MSILFDLAYQQCLQTEPYTPEERPDYPPPAKLPAGMDICLTNTPLLQNISTSLAAVPYLPEALWLHEVIGPAIFNFSLTETNLMVKLPIFSEHFESLTSCSV